jgi:polysaccharide pyruvyl transferase WcaK-like protein
VRDHLSLGELSDLGAVGTATVVPDAASWFRGAEKGDFAEFLAGHGMSPERPYIVASVRAEDQPPTVRQVAAYVEDAAIALGAPIVLVPHCGTAPHDDRPALAAMTDHLAPDLDVVILDDIPPDPLAASLVRTARVSIGTRFHNAVLSASAGRPATLFYESEYDELRARGLAAMPGNAVNVRDASAGVAEADLLDVLLEPSTAPTYSDPHPLVDTVRRVGIMGGDGTRVRSPRDRREVSR